jgi:hypothetical protein
VTKEFLDLVQVNSQQRNRPSVDNPELLVPFDNTTAFVEYVLRCACKMSKAEWFVFSNWMNPYRDFSK